MAVLDVLNLNLGTEQNPNWVAHDLHDKRISTTAVTTATHLLATNAGVTAMNPITAANLASILGVAKSFHIPIGKALKIDYNTSGYSPVLQFEFTWSGTHSYGVTAQLKLYCAGYAPSFPKFKEEGTCLYIGHDTKVLDVYVYNIFRTQYNISVVDYDISAGNAAFRLDCFDCSTLADLVTAINDVPTNSLITTQQPKVITDFNTEVGERGKILRYNVSHEANTTNAPITGRTDIAQLEVSNWSNYFYMQRYFQLNATAQYERIGGGNPVSWGSWVRVQMV